MSSQLDAMRIAAEAMRHQSMYESFLSASVLPEMAKANRQPGDADLLHREMSNEDWAQGMSKAFSNAKFARLTEACIDIAHRDFIARWPVNALTFELNGRFPDDNPLSIAITRAYEYLVQDREEPRWQALLIFSLARMIAVNSKRGFESNQWTEATLMYFDMEKSLLSGDGAALARSVVKLDKMSGSKLPDMVGPRMLHALAEAAINATGSSMFNRTQ